MESDSKEIQIMRVMAWERAKGELNSILAAYWIDRESYEKMRDKVNEFVKDVEDNELYC